MANDKRQLQRKFVRQLLDACERDDFDAAVRLVERASLTDVDVDHPSAGALPVLHSLFRNSSTRVTDVFRRLIDAGADVNRRDPVTGDAPLHRAARSNRADLVDVLVESPAVEMDATDAAGWTPLGVAITSGGADVVRSLVRAGCNVNRANAAEDTPLTVCARNNLVELTRLLVHEAAELDVNGTDAERRTALIVAAEHGHEDVARVLIEMNGCWLDASDRYNRTALYFAAKFGHADIVRHLISSGADVNKADTKGLTAFASNEIYSFHRVVFRNCDSCLDNL